MDLKSDYEIVKEVYQLVTENIRHKNYEIIEINTYIQDDYIYNIIKYYKNNKPYRKVIKKKWRVINNGFMDKKSR